MTSTLERLTAPWREQVTTASRRSLCALWLFALLGGAHLARVGTPMCRALVGAALGLLALLWVVRWGREWRTWRSPRHSIGRVLVATDPELGGRALRALTLVERSQGADFAGSADLARYHFDKLLASTSPAAVVASAKRRAARWRWVTIGLLCGAGAAVAVGPMRVIEGWNVLMARGGRAPLSMDWLRQVRISAQPPSYLRMKDRALNNTGPRTVQPIGTTIVVQGIPVRDPRRLVLTDGAREVPFVGNGVAAWWPAGRSSKAPSLGSLLASAKCWLRSRSACRSTHASTTLRW